MDSSNCQTLTASPAEPGGLPFGTRIISLRRFLPKELCNQRFAGNNPRINSLGRSRPAEYLFLAGMV